jgi:hypothetical protein
MGSVDPAFAADLRDRLGLKRAVETGTFRGATTRKLAGLFESVATIELSPELHRRAEVTLGDLPNVRLLQGHSAERLAEVGDPDVATLYFLDGHWSGGSTSGADEQCPVLGELAAIGPGHPDDCIVIDDAHLFTSAPPLPYDADQWPTLLDVFDAIREHRPHHIVTVLGGQVIAAPARARPAIDTYGLRLQPKRRLRDHPRGIWNWLKQTTVVRVRRLRGRPARS